jgi:hypothetical protein
MQLLQSVLARGPFRTKYPKLKMVMAEYLVMFCVHVKQIYFYFVASASPKRIKLCRKEKCSAAGTILNLNISSKIFKEKDESALAYISGYIQKKVSCNTCKSSLQDYNDRHPFLILKTYTYASNTALCSSSKLFHEFVYAWETLFRQHISKVLHKVDVYTRLQSILSQVPFPNVCDTHSDIGDSLLTAFVTFRLHAYCRFRTRAIHESHSKKLKLQRLNIV